MLIKLLFRLFGGFFGQFIHTDKLAESFPVSVKAIIQEGNRVLLLLNERDEWDFPGGKLEKRNIVSTLVEETKEETNLNIKVGKLEYLDKHLVYRTDVIIAIYRVEIIAADYIQISHEHLQYNFFDLSEIQNLNVPPWVTSVLGL